MARSNDVWQCALIDTIRYKVRKYPIIHRPAHRLVCLLRCAKSFVNWYLFKLSFKLNHNGLNTTEQRPKKIKASLTSYPGRIEIVPYAIASLLNQTMKPDKIILWLGEDKFPDKKLPKIFDELEECGVEVKFCPEDLKPHTKYFYTMKEYPEDIVITFDDDYIYSRHIIKILYESYIQHPSCVTGIYCTKMTFNHDGNIKSIADWEYAYVNSKGHESHTYFLAGVGGVLYPPHSLHPEVFNVEAMKKLCPKADDVWLKFMEVMNNTRAVPASNGNGVMGNLIPYSQEEALHYFNDHQGGNDIQIKALLEEYNTRPEGRTLLEMMREDA